MNIKMGDTLHKYGFDMIGFVKHLNDKYGDNHPLWVDYPKSFFSDHNKREEFLTRILKQFRNKKIDKLLNV